MRWVMSFGSEFWVAVAFFIFCGVLLYIGVHRKIADALNGRQGQIKAELDEARQLRDEAEDLLAQYLRKQHEVEREAADIIAVAEVEANRITGDAKANMEELIARRTKMVEARIAQAEAQALLDVHSAVAEAAIGAAEKMLIANAKGSVADHLITRSIKTVKTSLGNGPIHSA
jgi:F-type H+-transporting ATPase subunit b